MSPFLSTEVLPGALYHHNQTLQDAFSFGKLFASSYYHPACSCRLGQVRLSTHPPTHPPTDSRKEEEEEEEDKLLTHPIHPPTHPPRWSIATSASTRSKDCESLMRPSFLNWGAQDQWVRPLPLPLPLSLSIHPPTHPLTPDASILPQLGSAGPVGTSLLPRPISLSHPPTHPPTCYHHESFSLFPLTHPPTHLLLMNRVLYDDWGQGRTPYPGGRERGGGEGEWREGETEEALEFRNEERGKEEEESLDELKS